MVAPEIVRLQEEAHPPAGLVADARPLRVVAGHGQQQAGGARAGRRDAHPALAAAQVGVFAQREAQRVAIVRDGAVVVVDQQGDQAEDLHEDCRMSVGAPHGRDAVA